MKRIMRSFCILLLTFLLTPQVSYSAEFVETLSSVETISNDNATYFVYKLTDINGDPFVDGDLFVKDTSKEIGRNEAFYDTQATASGGVYVVWSEILEGESNAELYLFDGIAKKKITDFNSLLETYHAIRPKINGNGEMTWVGFDEDNIHYVYRGNAYDSGLYDMYPRLSEPPVTPPNPLVNYSHIDAHPQINSNGIIVWHGNTANLLPTTNRYSDIYLSESGNSIDWSSASLGCYFSGTAKCDHEKPSINNNNQITWSEYTISTTTPIGLLYSTYNSSLGTVYELSQDKLWSPEVVSVNGIAKVMFDGRHPISDSGDVFIWEPLTTPSVTNPENISNSQTWQDQSKSINDNGDVVWESSNTTSPFTENPSDVISNIYLKPESGASLSITNVSALPYRNHGANINNSGIVVWYGDTNATPDTLEDVNYRIFARYDNGDVEQLTDDLDNDYIKPKINDNGDIVWQKLTSSGIELYFALNVSTYDQDHDGILEDWDRDGEPGENPCTGGNRTNCDDNCPDTPNADQADRDYDSVGDACDICKNIYNQDQNTTDVKGAAGTPDECELFWTDSTLQGTVIKAIHVSELRGYINILRKTDGQSAKTWNTSLDIVKWQDFDDLHVAIEVLEDVSYNWNWTTFISGDVVYGDHLQEIRDTVITRWPSAN